MKVLSSICLITPDVPRLRAFYRDMLQIEPDGDAGFSSFSLPGGRLALFSEADMDRMAPGCVRGAGRGASVLEFEVDDVDAECERLGALDAAIVKPPTTQPWGNRSVWFRDPDGHLINFYAHVGERAVRTPREVARRFFQRLLNDHDLSACDAYLSPQYRDHDAGEGALLGPEPAKVYVTELLATYPDLHVTIDDLVVEGDRVAGRLHWVGTHATTRAPFDQRGLVWLRFDVEGRIAERWSAYWG